MVIWLIIAFAVCKPAAKHGGGFSTSSKPTEGLLFHCVKCAKKLSEDETSLNETIQSSADSSISSAEQTEEALETIFDKVDEEELTRIELTVEQGLPEWREKTAGPKQYSIGYLEHEKVTLVDFSELPAKEITKTLLEDVYKISGDLQAEELYAAVSMLDPEKDRIIRNLVVYGFEKAEGKRFTSNPDVVMLRIEVNQEDDFVDLI